MQGSVKRKTSRRLTVIGRWRPWDVSSMAKVQLAYVLHRLHEQDSQIAATDPSHDDGAPAC